MTEQLLNLKLVSEVEKYPCLYNYSLTEYSKKECTDKAWNKIAKAVNLPGSQCKEKWKNLRAVFGRYMKPSAKKKKTYYLAEAMRFTLPFIRALNPTSYGDVSNVDQNDVSNSEANNDDDVRETLGILKSTSTSYQSSQSPQASTPPPSPPPAIGKQSKTLPKVSSQLPASSEIFPQPPAKKKYRKSTDDDTEFGRAKRTRTETSTESDMRLEYKRMFLISLLPDLSEMSGSQMRKFRLGVAYLIEDILNESEHSQNPRSRSPMPASYYERLNLRQDDEPNDEENVDSKNNLLK